MWGSPSDSGPRARRWSRRERLVRLLNENGYPNARIVASQYLANRDTKTLTATWTVDTGPLARFGDLQVNGLNVNPEYVQRIADWKPGSVRYSRDRARSNDAVEYRLFAMISPPPRSVPVENGVVR